MIFALFHLLQVFDIKLLFVNLYLRMWNIGINQREISQLCLKHYKLRMNIDEYVDDKWDDNQLTASGEISEP